MLCGASVLRAQSAVVDSAATRDSASARDATTAPARRAPWITRGELIALGSATLLTGAVAPFDHPISGEFTEADWRRRRVQHVAGDIAFFGGMGPFAASAVMAAASVTGAHPEMRAFAVHDMEAIALATVVNGIGKGIFGRALPGVHTPHKFQFGRGFHRDNGPFVAFPSGHTAAAFALASTIAGEVARDDPAHATLVARLAYGGAAAVGMARVVQREHWPSDLPLAAVIGTWSGHVVQRHADAHSRVGAALRGLTIAPASHGQMLIGWSSSPY